ncbi:FMN-binding negative transcriptional regulator [Streptomyces qinglanensis]|uniref:FMN-binding negative transcriptional regulator n=1 Tax=Streptomyces qinglanensis TaxID=943816 RepID=UPI0037AFCFBC
MHVPEGYRPTDPCWARDVVRTQGLALLVTDGSGADGPMATHCPVIPWGDPATGTGETGLVGTELAGHLNRENPHWAELREGRPALLVFPGPNSYVSPAHYGLSPAAPTWNFVSVHAHGTLHPRQSGEPTLEVIRTTVRAYEEHLGTGWDMTDSLPYFEQILPGVGAFTFRVTRAEGMFKLSQEKSATVRERVGTALTDSPHRAAHLVAAAMRRYG